VLAWPLTRLAVGALDDFINRWAAWFASAYAGELNQPLQMPETTIEKNWRSN
jgi:eukaryotic-like serine/threonine-protein kinase